MDHPYRGELDQVEESIGNGVGEILHQLVDHVQDICYLYDIDQEQVLYINPTYETIWGRSRKSIYENDNAWRDAVHPADRKRVFAEFRRMVDGDPAFDNVSIYRIVRPDGTVRWVQHRGFPIEQGDSRRIVVIITDITDHKLAEEAVLQNEKKYRELESRVAQRTAELTATNDRLRDEIEQRRRMQEILESIVEATSATSGTDFFAALAAQLTKLFDVRYALIVEHLDHPPTRVRSLAFCADGEAQDAVEYDLASGPCESTASGKVTFYPKNVQQTFPLDDDLVKMGAESYCGLPLLDRKGRIIGHLALLDDHPMSINHCEVPALQIFVSRIATELERQQADELLQESRSQLQTVVASAPVAITAINCEGIIDVHEGNALRNVGMRPGEGVGRFFEEHWKPAPQLIEMVRNGLSGRATNSVQTDLGGVVFESRCSTIRSSDDEILGAIVVCVDITDEKQTEKHLRESEERFRMLAENIPGVVYLCENDARYTMRYLNDAVEELTGYPKEDFLQDRISFVELYHPDDASEIAPVVDEAIAHRRSYELTYRIKHRDGQWRWIYEVGIGVFHQDRLAFLEGFLTDVTERKQAAERLEQKQAELTHVARLSTMGEIVAGIAHELSQPLGAILNNVWVARTELATGDKDINRAIELLDRVTKSAERAGQVIHRLKQLLRRRTTSRSTIHVNPLINEAIEVLDHRIVASRVRVNRQLNDELPTILADRVQILQVLINLIQNAIDAMAGLAMSERELTVHSAMGENGEAVLIQVKDSGGGVQAESLPHIFEPFFTTKPEGMGMGLAISRTIIEAHGGQLCLEPADESGGTSFTLTLPMQTIGKIRPT